MVDHAQALDPHSLDADVWGGVVGALGCDLRGGHHDPPAGLHVDHSAARPLRGETLNRPARAYPRDVG